MRPISWLRLIGKQLSLYSVCKIILIMKQFFDIDFDEQVSPLFDVCRGLRSQVFSFALILQLVNFKIVPKYDYSRDDNPENLKFDILRRIDKH